MFHLPIAIIQRFKNEEQAIAKTPRSVSLQNKTGAE
jgi:hypothetical protein